MKILYGVRSKNVEETIEYGRTLLERIPEEVNLIFLKGEIGAGKTSFVKGLALALGIKDTITSPTFGYKREYKGLVHYDFFLNKKMKKKEIESLISEDLEDNIVVIEWGEKIHKIKDSIVVEIVYDGEDQRNIIVKEVD